MGLIIKKLMPAEKKGSKMTADTKPYVIDSLPENASAAGLRHGAAEALHMVMPKEFADTCMGHSMAGSASEYVGNLTCHTIPGARVLAGYGAPVYGHKGPCPKPARLASLVPFSVDAETLTRIVDEVYGFNANYTTRSLLSGGAHRGAVDAAFASQLLWFKERSRKRQAPMVYRKITQVLIDCNMASTWEASTVVMHDWATVLREQFDIDNFEILTRGDNGGFAELVDVMKRAKTAAASENAELRQIMKQQNMQLAALNQDSRQQNIVLGAMQQHMQQVTEQHVAAQAALLKLFVSGINHISVQLPTSDQGSSVLQPPPLSPAATTPQVRAPLFHDHEPCQGDSLSAAGGKFLSFISLSPRQPHIALTLPYRAQGSGFSAPPLSPAATTSLQQNDDSAATQTLASLQIDAATLFLRCAAGRLSVSMDNYAAAKLIRQEHSRGNKALGFFSSMATTGEMETLAAGNVADAECMKIVHTVHDHITTMLMSLYKVAFEKHKKDCAAQVLQVKTWKKFCHSKLGGSLIPSHLDDMPNALKKLLDAKTFNDSLQYANGKWPGVTKWRTDVELERKRKAGDSVEPPPSQLQRGQEGGSAPPHTVAAMFAAAAAAVKGKDAV
jgi:hypothetical protein